MHRTDLNLAKLVMNFHENDRLISSHLTRQLLSMGCLFSWLLFGLNLVYWWAFTWSGLTPWSWLIIKSFILRDSIVEKKLGKNLKSNSQVNHTCCRQNIFMINNLGATWIYNSKFCKKKKIIRIIYYKENLQLINNKYQIVSRRLHMI